MDRDIGRNLSSELRGLRETVSKTNCEHNCTLRLLTRSIIHLIAATVTFALKDVHEAKPMPDFVDENICAVASCDIDIQDNAVELIAVQCLMIPIREANNIDSNVQGLARHVVRC